MTTSPTSAERAALRVAHAVPLESSNPGYSLIDQIVFALGSAQMLQSPETAAEMARLRARVAELEAETYVAPSPSCTRCYGADAVRFVDKGGATSPCRVCGPSEVEQLRARVAELEQQLTAARDAGYAAAIEVMRQEKLPMSVGLLEAQRELDTLDADGETEGGPVPFVLTERAQAELLPAVVTTYADQSGAGLRRLLHPLDGGVSQ